MKMTRIVVGKPVTYAVLGGTVGAVRPVHPEIIRLGATVCEAVCTSNQDCESTTVEREASMASV